MNYEKAKQEEEIATVLPIPPRQPEPGTLTWLPLVIFGLTEMIACGIILIQEVFLVDYSDNGNRRLYYRPIIVGVGISSFLYSQVGGTAVSRGCFQEGRFQNIRERHKIIAVAVFSAIGVPIACTVSIFASFVIYRECHWSSQNHCDNDFTGWSSFLVLAITTAVQGIVGLLITIFCCYKCYVWRDCLLPEGQNTIETT